MKIVIVGPAHPYRGGIAKFNEVLAENFVKQGHDVQIANFTLQYPALLFPGKSQYTTDVAPTGYRIDRFINSINPCSWWSAARRIRDQKPDLVIIRYWMPFFAPALGMIARKQSCPVIALTDNIIPHEGHFFDKACTGYFLRSIGAAVYMSAQVGEELELFKFKGIKTFSPHPIYDSYGQTVSKAEACAKLSLDPEVNYSLFFGFIRDYKGLDLLLRAWAELSDKTLKLIIAGEYYGNKEKYDTLIAELGISDRLIVRDEYIPENDVRYYFSVADLVIQPYRSATQSGVTQVAYNFGIPMIVTNVGGLAEIVPHGKVGYIVEQSPTQIRQAIEDFYTNNRAAIFRQNMEIEKKRFEWHEMTKTFVNLWEEMKSKL